MAYLGCGPLEKRRCKNSEFQITDRYKFRDRASGEKNATFGLSASKRKNAKIIDFQVAIINCARDSIEKNAITGLWPAAVATLK